jgi:hypothetical protein
MKKLEILELDLSVIKETFTAYSAGIWQKTLSLDDDTKTASPITTIFGATWTIGSDPLQIGTVRIDDILYGSVGSIAELYLQEASFYFDADSQIVYIALSDYDNALPYRKYLTGETSGFITEAQEAYINGKKFPIDSYFGSLRYNTNLIGGSGSSISTDDQEAGIFVFDTLTAKIRNADGEYDLIRDEVTGNEARYLVADLPESEEEAEEWGLTYKTKADYSDFSVVQVGIVDEVSYSNPDQPVITAIDPRSDWTQTIGENFLTTDEFADLEEKWEDKRKPILIGQVNGSECIPLSDDPDTSSDFDFLICDTSIGDINTVDNIYFEGSINSVDYDQYLTSDMYEVDTTTGILTIYDYDSGDAWFYGQVTDMTETVEIILFLLSEYAGISYIESNFNQTEVEKIRALNYETHVYIDDGGEELVDVIEKLVMDIQVDFIQQGLLLTMRDTNEERESSETILPRELTDNPAPWVNDRTSTCKTITATYNQDYRQETYTTYYDDSEEQTALDNNRKAEDIEFETNLVNQADVAAIYGQYYTRFVVPSRTITINRRGPITAGLSDFITHTVTRITTDNDKEIFTNGKYKIVKINKVKNTLEAVYFSDVTEDVYIQGFAAGSVAAHDMAAGSSTII